MFFAFRHDVGAKVDETNLAATVDSGTGACVRVCVHACVNSYACMPVRVHACTFRCVHACVSCVCVLLACVRLCVLGVCVVFCTSAQIRSYFESKIARGQLYLCFSTSNVHQIDSAVRVEML